MPIAPNWFSQKEGYWGIHFREGFPILLNKKSGLTIKISIHNKKKRKFLLEYKRSNLSMTEILTYKKVFTLDVLERLFVDNEMDILPNMEYVKDGDYLLIRHAPYNDQFWVGVSFFLTEEIRNSMRYFIESIKKE